MGGCAEGNTLGNGVLDVEQLAQQGTEQTAQNAGDDNGGGGEGLDAVGLLDKSDAHSRGDGFGQQGYGYNVAELHNEIGKILGVDKRYGTILIGAGNLGKAMATHMNFEKRGIKLLGIFDSNRSIVGEKVADITISHTDDLDKFCSENQPIIAILCIPKTSAQEIADRLVKLGIKAFWNFSHYDLRPAYSGIIVENVHLGDSLMTLAYGVNNNLNL